MLTVIIFIIILGLLIFVHELGHFLVAKKNGVKVEEFGFGFPPRIFGIKRGETIYSLNLIPLGGFVKILGEDGQERHNPCSFATKKIWQRAVILAAGVTMNVVLAVFLLGLGLGIGLPTAIDDEKDVEGAIVKITQVDLESPAQAAGIKIGDAVIKMKSHADELTNIDKVRQVQDFTDENKGQEIVVALQRGKEIFDIKIVPRENPPLGEGPLGVGLARVAIISYPWHQALYKGAADTFRLAGMIIVALGSVIWNLLTQGRMVVDILGPVGIYSITGQAAQLGFIYLLQLTALLSINLAIINAFPFPALDGGRLLFLLIEKIKGSPVSQKIEKAVHSAGFVFLILLMVLVTIRDIAKIF